jgi:23S rRNA (guanosine2251-2'-O)-methyltransferase
VTELLEARPEEVVCLYLAADDAQGGRGRLAELAAAAHERGLSVELRDRAELDALTGDGNHQGVVAICGEFRYAEPEELLAGAERAGQVALLVALDQVTDPHNLGAVIRSAYLMGAHGVIILRDHAAAITPVVTKAAAGATEHLPVAQVTNLSRTLAELKSAGLWTCAVAAGPEARPVWELDASMPLCLVLGSEGRGLRRLVNEQCDFRVQVPMAARGVGSLNVSVACGMVLYEILRQRQAGSAARSPELAASE